MTDLSTGDGQLLDNADTLLATTSALLDQAWHQLTPEQVPSFFPGLEPGDLPDGEGWAVERLNIALEHIVEEPLRNVWGAPQAFEYGLDFFWLICWEMHGQWGVRCRWGVSAPE